MADERRLKDDLRAAYDLDAARRSAMTPEPWRVAVVDEWLGELRPRGLAAVLELGCGAGQLAVHVMEAGFEVTAIDLSPGNVTAARRRGVEASVADFAHLPYPDAAFDAAFSVNALHHVPPGDLEAVLTEVRRVLRVGALLLIVVWGGVEQEGPIADEWLDPPRYFSLHTDEQAAAITAPGYRTVRFDTLEAEREGNLHPQVLVLEAT